VRYACQVSSDARFCRRGCTRTQDGDQDGDHDGDRQYDDWYGGQHGAQDWSQEDWGQDRCQAANCKQGGGKCKATWVDGSCNSRSS
jgi:hypothetical protein